MKDVCLDIANMLFQGLPEHLLYQHDPEYPPMVFPPPGICRPLSTLFTWVVCLIICLWGLSLRMPQIWKYLFLLLEPPLGRALPSSLGLYVVWLFYRMPSKTLLVFSGPYCNIGTSLAHFEQAYHASHSWPGVLFSKVRVWIQITIEVFQNVIN